MNPMYSKQDRLFRYMADIVDISAELIQNSCDISINNHKGQWCGPSSAGSLKINDYKNNKSTQTKAAPKTTSKGCQAAQGCSWTVTPEPSGQRFAPNTSVSFSNDILNDIDHLGASLDGKITAFVKLLVNLKEGSDGSGDASRRKRVPSMVGTISKIIHELTEDTKKLAVIKSRLDPCEGHQESQSYSVGPSTSNQRARGASANFQDPRANSALSYDLPLQQAHL